MDKKALLLIGLITIGLAIAQEAGNIPTSIPADIVKAGAQQEYVETVCAMARYRMQQFIDGTNALKNHFDDMVAQFPNDVTLDTTVITTLGADMESRLNALCTATPATYTTAIQGIIDVAQGGGGIESTLRGLGAQLQNQLQAKGDNYQAQAQALLGGLSPDEFESIKAQVQTKAGLAESLQAQLQSGQGDMQSIYQQLESVGAELQSLQAQLGSIDEGTEAQANALRDEADSFGNKVQEVFGQAESKMRQAFEGGDYSSLKAVANEKQYALFIKMFDSNIVDLGSVRAELASHEIDTSVFDEVDAWIRQKKEQAREVFTGDATEDDIMSFVAEISSEGKALEARITALIEEQVTDKWLSKFSDLKGNADEGLAKAREYSLDTSEVEALMAQLEGIKDEANTLVSQGNRESALNMIKQAEALIPQLQNAYTKLQEQGAQLQAEGESIQAQAEQFMNQLDARRDEIHAFATSAEEAGIDTSILQSMLNELENLGNEARIKTESGDYPGAVALFNTIKAKYQAVQAEYNRIAGEMA